MKNNKFNMSRFMELLFIAILISFSGFAVMSMNQKDETIELQEINLEDKNIKIDELQSNYDNVVEELNSLKDELDTTKSKYSEKKEKIKQLEEEKANLESQLQAKLEQKEKLAKAAQITSTASATSAPVGSCRDWMVQAGISDMDNAYILIMRESSCNPSAVNASSGACGIGQQLPCGKWKHQWDDPVGAMIDMQEYVYQRYGSWANAVNFHNQNHWY